MTPEYRKMLWDPLRGDGQTFQGGGSVSRRLPGFEKADFMDESVGQVLPGTTIYCIKK